MGQLTWGTPAKIIDAVTVNAGAESSLSTEADLDSCVGVYGISVQSTFNASATEGGVLRVYPSYDGTNYSSEPVEIADISKLNVGSANQQHFYFPISCRKVKVTIENSDDTYAITAVSVWAHKQLFSE